MPRLLFAFLHHSFLRNLFLSISSPQVSLLWFTMSMRSLSKVNPIAVARRGFSSSSTTAPFMVCGNWKCNGSSSSAENFISKLNSSSLNSKVTTVVAPSALHASTFANNMRRDIAVGVQDAVPKSGAFTGSVSSSMAKDAGYVKLLECTFPTA